MKRAIIIAASAAVALIVASSIACGSETEEPLGTSEPTPSEILFLFDELGVFVVGSKFCERARHDETVDFDLPGFTWNVITRYGVPVGGAEPEGIKQTFVVPFIDDIDRWSIMQWVEEVLDQC